jgi:hypothetical protein
MKVEPIRLNMPIKPSSTPKRGMTPKSPNIKAATTSTTRLNTKKRMSLCSNTSTNTTPIPISSSSSSSAEGGVSVIAPPKKSLSTRREKRQSHLGIMSSRRASLKEASTSQVVTPPLKSATGLAAATAATNSPRVRPRSTHRQSLANLENKSSPSLVVTATAQAAKIAEYETTQQGTATEYYSGSRKLSSSAYSSSSRKNSLEENGVDKDKGKPVDKIVIT